MGSTVIELVNAESVGLCSERLERVSEWLAYQVSSERLAGASVLIGRRGQCAYFEAAGMADKETGLPFAEDTIVFQVSGMNDVPFISAQKELTIEKNTSFSIGFD